MISVRVCSRVLRRLLAKSRDTKDLRARGPPGWGDGDSCQDDLFARAGCQDGPAPSPESRGITPRRSSELPAGHSGAVVGNEKDQAGSRRLFWCAPHAAVHPVPIVTVLPDVSVGMLRGSGARIEVVMTGMPFGEMVVQHGAQRGDGHHNDEDQGDGPLDYAAKDARRSQA